MTKVISNYTNLGTTNHDDQSYAMHAADAGNAMRAWDNVFDQQQRHHEG